MRRWLFIILAVVLSGWFPPTAFRAYALRATPNYDAAASVEKVVVGDGITMDTYEGGQEDPGSLHKYLYCHGDGVNFSDPSGHNDLPSFSIATTISVGMNAYSAGANIRAGRYGWAAVDILSMGLGIGGMIGPGGLGKLAFAANIGRDVSFAGWIAAAKGAQQVSQGMAVFDLIMMAMSGATPGSSLGSSGEGTDGGDLLPNKKASEYQSELATARANGVQSIVVTSADQLEKILYNNPVIKWVVTPDGKLRVVPKFVNPGRREISHAVAAENQMVKAAGEARLKGNFLEFNRFSGHYEPPSYSPGERALGGLGIPVKYMGLNEF